MTAETDLPKGHIRFDGRHYVALELFEAANAHVLEQGLYCNQLIGTLNEQGRTIRALQADKDRLQQEIRSTRGALVECQRTQMAMRAAVYGAVEGL
jgi:hypothetical protein